MVDRRAAGEPLEQVVGWAEFAGLRIFVDPGVFVPRRRSEFLVSVAVRLAGSRAAAPRVIVDLCCGTGALGLAVAVELSEALRGRPALAVAGERRRRPGLASVGSAASSCTPPTSTRPPSRARGGTSSRRAGTSTGRPVRRAARRAARPGRRPDLQRAVRADDEIAFLPAEARDHEARDRPGRRPRRAGRAAPGRGGARRGWLAPGGVLLVETSEQQAPADGRGDDRRRGWPRGCTTTTEYGATVVTGYAQRHAVTGPCLSLPARLAP